MKGEGKEKEKGEKKAKKKKKKKKKKKTRTTTNIHIQTLKQQRHTAVMHFPKCAPKDLPEGVIAWIPSLKPCEARGAPVRFQCQTKMQGLLHVFDVFDARRSPLSLEWAA